jgi:PAS domain S-box-containing protein
MKISERFMVLNVAVIAVAIIIATLFSLAQMRGEAMRQASAMQESHLKTFWELLHGKGREFRVVAGRLLVGDYILSGNYELPDRVKEIFGGTATIFMGDVRVSTNVLQENGQRAVATRLTGPAYDALFRQGSPYRGEANILGVPYFTAYDPIRDRDGRVIGALYVGVRKSDFLATYEKLAIRQTIMAGLLVGLFTIVTIVVVRERRDAEAALTESEQRFRRTFDQSPIGAAIVSLDYRFLRVNGQLCRITGYGEQELLDLSLSDISHPDDLAADLALKGQLIAGEREMFQMDKRCLRRNRTVFWARLSVCLMKDALGKPLYYLPMIEDITEQKRLEQEVQKVEKLESLGVLAGGIAHDFNNLLTGILGNISLAKASLPAEDKIYRRLDDAERTAERAKELTSRLLTFAKGGVPVTKPADLGQIITDATESLLQGSTIVCEYAITGDLPYVELDKGQIGQVVRNLVSNALDAMAHGGYLVVSAEQVPQSPTVLPEGQPSVRLSVRDTGSGIQDDILPRIFDPYFTTKPKGSGLGLTIVYAIVKNHGGCVEVESTRDLGTVFHVYLPVKQHRTA